MNPDMLKMPEGMAEEVKRRVLEKLDRDTWETLASTHTTAADSSGDITHESMLEALKQFKPVVRELELKKDPKFDLATISKRMFYKGMEIEVPIPAGLDRGGSGGYVTSVDRNDSNIGGGPVKQTQVMVNVNGEPEPKFIDVELHGEMVALSAIKSAIKKDKGLTQAKLSEHTEEFTEDGKPIHQTTISGYLLGDQEITTVFQSVLEDLFNPDEANAMAAVKAAPVKRIRKSSGASFPQQTVPVGMKSMARPKGVFAKPDTGEDESVVGTIRAKLPQFDVEKAQKMVSAVRKGNAEGSISSTFSLRKIIMWGQSYYLLLSEGYEKDAAIAGGFHLAAAAKTYGEDERFLKDMFQSIYGFEAAPPSVHGNTARSEGNRHPMDFIVEPLVRNGFPVYLAGPTGSGKSHSAYDIAHRTGRPYMRVQGEENFIVDDLVGGKGARSGSTHYEYGPLPQMMRAGGVLILDEPTVIPAAVLMELQAVLEGEPLVLKRNRGEVILPEPGFTVICTDNSLGLGEAIEYVGTQPLNEAFRDRFLFVQYAYMPPSQEKLAVESNLSRFLMDREWATVGGE